MDTASDTADVIRPRSGDQPAPEVQGTVAVSRLSLREILSRPLRGRSVSDKVLVWGIMLFARRQIRAIHGLENLQAAGDPVIFAFNHSIRRESVLLSGVLVFLRGGGLVHIWANWIYRMIPGVGWMMRHAGTINIVAQPPPFKFLNRFKHFYVKPEPPMEQARALLLGGHAFGAFPEGRLSRDPRRMLPGRLGTARLSLETGVPVVPVGIRFPGADLDQPIPENATMEVYIGEPLRTPAGADDKPSNRTVMAWHATIMTEIARLAGKSWQPRGAKAAVAADGD